MKKKILIIMSSTIILLAVTYNVLLHDTDTVMDDFKHCMNWHGYSIRY